MYNFLYSHVTLTTVLPDLCDQVLTYTHDFRSTRPAPNIGNFHCIHLDTDDANTESEQDERPMDMDSKNVEESSEEEWTYKCGGEGGEDSSAQNEASSLCQSTETLSPAPKTRQEMLPKDELKKLIDGAEPIAMHASPTRKPRDFLPLVLDANRSKRKVNEWMSKEYHPEHRKTQVILRKSQDLLKTYF